MDLKGEEMAAALKMIDEEMAAELTMKDRALKMRDEEMAAHKKELRAEQEAALEARMSSACMGDESIEAMLREVEQRVEEQTTLVMESEMDDMGKAERKLQDDMGKAEQAVHAAEVREAATLLSETRLKAELEEMQAQVLDMKTKHEETALCLAESRHDELEEASHFAGCSGCGSVVVDVLVLVPRS